MSQHTPGPWMPLDPTMSGMSGMIIAGDCNHPIAEVRGWGWLQKKGKAGEEEQDANLRLIAAAPDMKAALIAARGGLAWVSIPNMPEAGKIIQQIDRALALAGA